MKIISNWMRIAECGTGVASFPPGQFNPRIMEYHATTSFQARDDKAAWCSSFINWCFMQVGIAGTGSALARSWLDWGRPVATPRWSCVAILYRDHPASWKGHVGFFLRADTKYVHLLSGNQLDQVCEHYYPLSSVLGYRLPLQAFASPPAAREVS